MPAMFVKKILIEVLASLLADLLVCKIKDVKEKYDERKKNEPMEPKYEIVGEWEF